MSQLLLFLLALYQLQTLIQSDSIDGSQLNPYNDFENELNAILPPTLEDTDNADDSNEIDDNRYNELIPEMPMIKTAQDKAEIEFRKPIKSVNIDYTKNAITLKFHKEPQNEKNLAEKYLTATDFMRFGKRVSELQPTGANEQKAKSDNSDKAERFERSPENFKNYGSVGIRDSRGDNFMRFGRSPGQDFMRFGRDPGDFMRFGRGPADFMRLGRSPGQDFMRFGRNPGQDFMRFGRSPAGQDFMRFGRSPAGQDFMRFGRSPAGQDFMRFGRIPAGQDFMRFGRSPGQDFMRFGRSPGQDFMRFGRNPTQDFMRLGRPDNFMRLGRSSPNKKLSTDMNFMRFGRPDNFMRFGRSPTEPQNDHTLSNFMRFGRSDKSFLGKDDKAHNNTQVTLEQKQKIKEVAKIIHDSQQSNENSNPMDKAIEVLFNKENGENNEAKETQDYRR